MNSNRKPETRRPSDQQVQDRRHPSPDGDADAFAAARSQHAGKAQRRQAIASKEDAQQILELRLALAEHRLRRPPEQPTPLPRSG
jgi:hypothetical protein